MMYEDVEVRQRRKNKILFTKDSACLQSLLFEMQDQERKVLVLWAFACLRETLSLFLEKYPNEKRPETAIEVCKKWSKGEVKMPVAKRTILDCHQVCKEIDDDYAIALCHAIGQGVSTVHVKTHAFGLIFYELTALVLKDGKVNPEKLDQKIKYYHDTLHFIQSHIEQINYPFAHFLVEKK